MRRAPGTVVKYTQHLRPFVEWAGGRALADITASEIEFEFLGPWSLTVEKPTLRNRIAALNAPARLWPRPAYAGPSYRDDAASWSAVRREGRSRRPAAVSGLRTYPGEGVKSRLGLAGHQTRVLA